MIEIISVIVLIAIAVYLLILNEKIKGSGHELPLLNFLNNF
jgi:hypothetical protein